MGMSLVLAAMMLKTALLQTPLVHDLRCRRNLGRYLVRFVCCLTLRFSGAADVDGEKEARDRMPFDASGSDAHRDVPSPNRGGISQQLEGEVDSRGIGRPSLGRFSVPRCRMRRIGDFVVCAPRLELARGPGRSVGMHLLVGRDPTQGLGLSDLRSRRPISRRLAT